MAKIAMLLSNPYAPDERVYREATSLIRRGHSVTLYAWDRQGEHPPRATEAGVKVERLQIRASYGRGARSLVAFVRFGLAVVRRLLATPFDAVHCHDLDTLPFGYLAARWRGKPVVYDAHEPFSLYTRFPGLLRRTLGVLEGWLARRADRVVTVTPAMVRWFKTLGVHGARLVANYPHHIFDLPDGPVSKPPGQPLVVGWIGNLRPDNQLELVIDAVGRFNARHPDAPLRLLLVGRTLPGYRQTLLERARPLGDHFRLVGPVPHPQVPDYYRQADIAIIVDADVPQKRLALALKLFESMAMGLPVIVHPTGDTPQVVQDAGCGLVLADYEIDTVVAALERLAADPAARLAMGRNGWQAVRERYNWAVSEQTLFSVYDDLLGAAGEHALKLSPAGEQKG